MRTRTAITVALAAFAAAFALVIATRLTTESLALLTGVAAGVLASLPATAILAWALLRGGSSPRRERVVYDHARPRSTPEPARVATRLAERRTYYLPADAQPAALPPWSHAPLDPDHAGAFTAPVHRTFTDAALQPATTAGQPPPVHIIGGPPTERQHPSL